MKLTPTQRRILARIVATNGGGLHPSDLTGGEQQALWALVRRGLAQGKRTQQSWVVHTREGLEQHRRG